MKIRLEEAGAMGILRCPIDNTTLLTFQNDDITLQQCDHYRWHATGDDDDVMEAIKRESGFKEDNEKDDEHNEEVDEEEEEDWDEVLKANYIASVTVEGAVFYLIPVEKAVKEG